MLLLSMFDQSTSPNRRRRQRVCAAALVAASLLGACGTTPPGAPTVRAASQAACDRAAQENVAPSRARVFALAARTEHAAWGNSTMDSSGRLVSSGASEAEDTSRPFGGPAPWQRVMSYWRAVDPPRTRLPYIVRYGDLQRADRTALQAELAQLAANPSGSPEGTVDPGPRPGMLEALRVAVDRVAVVDTPWSAAFVSWAARQAGLHDEEFLFSEAHADYAGAAYQAGVQEALSHPARSALRACDLARTTPRVGDLVCQARAGEAGLNSFEKIGEVLAERPTGGEPLPMHCDIVSAIDDFGFEAIGGNVLQSVTRRRMDFAPGTRLLDASYFTDRCQGANSGCVDRHMSRQPWSLLLQWR